MTDIPNKMTIKNSSGESREVPIPEHIQIEMAACAAMDDLGVAWLRFGATFLASVQACNSAKVSSDPSEVQVEWAQSLLLLQAALHPLETASKELIDKMSKMLGV
jgi:hypothetical protein